MSREQLRREAGQSIESMAEQMKENNAGNRLYKPTYGEVSQELKQAAIATAIDQARGALKTAKKKGRVDLKDVDALHKAADDYMCACKLSGTIPTMLGFAPSIGHSRQNVYEFILRNSRTESARFLDSLRSAWAAIFQQLAMTRVCSEPVAIFALKNAGQGMADKTDVDMAVTNNSRNAWYEDEELSQDELMARMKAYLGPEYDDTGNDDSSNPQLMDYEG